MTNIKTADDSVLRDRNQPQSSPDLERLIQEARNETDVEPVRAVVIPPTSEERVSRCQEEIQASLARWGCQIVASWESVSDNMQVRSKSIQIVVK